MYRRCGTFLVSLPRNVGKIMKDSQKGGAKPSPDGPTGTSAEPNERFIIVGPSKLRVQPGVPLTLATFKPAFSMETFSFVATTGFFASFGAFMASRELQPEFWIFMNPTAISIAKAFGVAGLAVGWWFVRHDALRLVVLNPDAPSRQWKLVLSLGMVPVMLAPGVARPQPILRSTVEFALSDVLQVVQLRPRVLQLNIVRSSPAAFSFSWLKKRGVRYRLGCADAATATDLATLLTRPE
eukprot:RCo047838